MNIMAMSFHNIHIYNIMQMFDNTFHIRNEKRNKRGI